MRLLCAIDLQCTNTIIRYILVLGESKWLKIPALPLVTILMALLLVKFKLVKLNTLRQLLVAGEESGEAEYDLENLISELDGELKE